MGFSRQEYWSGLLCPPPGDLPNSGIEPRSPALQVDSLPSVTREGPLTVQFLLMPMAALSSQYSRLSFELPVVWDQSLSLPSFHCSFATSVISRSFLCLWPISHHPDKECWRPSHSWFQTPISCTPSGPLQCLSKPSLPSHLSHPCQVDLPKAQFWSDCFPTQKLSSASNYPWESWDHLSPNF